MLAEPWDHRPAGTVVTGDVIEYVLTPDLGDGVAKLDGNWRRIRVLMNGEDPAQYGEERMRELRSQLQAAAGWVPLPAATFVAAQRSHASSSDHAVPHSPRR